MLSLALCEGRGITRNTIFMEYKHTPVMLKEVLEVLSPSSGDYYIDCTLGGGGYTFELAKKVGSEGRVLALDLDDLAIKNVKKEIEKRKINNIVPVQENFKNLDKTAEEKMGKDVVFEGIVLDLGLSSAQLKDKERGFSFQKDSPLNLSFDSAVSQGNKSVKYILNNYQEKELFRIFKKFGEEPWAGPIARKIIKERKEKKIKTSKELSDIIEKSLPHRFLSRVHKIKARIFQALRITVNEELKNLEEALPKTPKLLKSGGILTVVSYHSLEDRTVKDFLKRESRDCLCPPEVPVCRCGHQAQLKIQKFKNKGKSKNFKTPEEKEIKKNPAARSARLRAAIKI